MSESDPPTATNDETSGHEAAWREIDELMAWLDDLAKSTADVDAFRERLLSRTAAVLGGHAGSIWWRHRNSLDHVKSFPASDVGSRCEAVGMSQLIAEIAANREPLRYQIDSSEVLYLHPILDGDDPHDGCLGVLELSISANRDRDEISAILHAVSEVVAENHQRTAIRRLQETSVNVASINRFTSQVYSGSDLRTTSFALANAGRDFIGCDRLSVLLPDGSQYRVHAVSGVDTINARSQAIRNMERLAERTARIGEDFWHGRTNEELPGQLSSLVESVVDSNHCRRLGISPLQVTPESPPVAVLVIEYFSHGNTNDAHERIALAKQHATVALHRASCVDQVPLWHLWQRLQLRRTIRRLIKSGAFVAVAIVAMIALLLVPVGFYVDASGSLQPVTQRNIFAPARGEVCELLVEHGSHVEKGQPLLRIRSADIDQNVQDLQGKAKAARERLAAIRVTRLKGNLRLELAETHRLSAEQTALTLQLDSLDSQLAIARQQQDSLTIRSPFDGQVITWDVANRLQHRPVQPGDHLLTVANTDGDWNLEVEIPDNRVSHVVSWRDRQSADNEVRFRMEADPGQEFAGELSQISNTAASDNNDERYIPATVSVPQDDLPTSLRAGAPARVRINCGSRPLAFVWFHELLHSVQTTFLF